jgi:antitoxin MazE
MEATVVRIGKSLGFKVPSRIVKDYDIEVGAKLEWDFNPNGNIVFWKKPKARAGWATAFAQYASEGEDKMLLPDFLDSETDTFL